MLAEDLEGFWRWGWIGTCVGKGLRSEGSSICLDGSGTYLSHDSIVERFAMPVRRFWLVRLWLGGLRWRALCWRGAQS